MILLLILVSHASLVLSLIRPQCPPPTGGERCFGSFGAQTCLEKFPNCTCKRFTCDTIYKGGSARRVCFAHDCECSQNSDCFALYPKDPHFCDIPSHTCKPLLVSAPGPDDPSEENENSSSSGNSWFMFMLTIVVLVMVLCSCIYSLL